jgi:DNA repair protein RadD
MIAERNYQTEAVDSVLNYWGNDGGNPLIEMATGTGKSVVLASLTKRLLTNWPDMRVLMLVHVKELVQQNATAILRAWPQAPLGINSAGLGRRDLHSQVLFGSIQSVYRIAERLGPRDVLMVDECHLMPRSGDGMYRSLLEELRDTVPDLRVVGFTATPYRLDTGRLDDGEGRLFDEVVYSYDLARAVADGYLSPLISRATATEIDVSGVARKGGEFVAGSLEAAADRSEVIEGACDEILQLAADRRSWLVFCSGIAHAAHVRDALRRRGISCETVTGETPSGQRDSIFKAFKEGRIRALTGVQVFTTGFDAPGVDMIAMLRPTLSTCLYVQMLGRGTRPIYPAGFNPNAATESERLDAIAGSIKSNCLVLDFAGNTRRHGPVDAVTVKSKKKVDPDDVESEPCPACQIYNPLTAEKCRHCGHILKPKICPECEGINVLSAFTCIHCGFIWKEKDLGPRHGEKAETDPVMTREIKDKWIKVNNMRASRHQKFDGGADSLVVQYQCGLRVYKEWICPEHVGYARAKFEQWWRALGGKLPAPKSISEALTRWLELAVVQDIIIARDGEWWRVVKRRVERDGILFEIDDRLFVRMVQKAESVA